MSARDQPLREGKGLVLGIDTGGTYTDGILMEYESRSVLATIKSLTTRRNFSIGIEKVIEGIRINEPEAIRLVSVSTTLATNAIAEGKGTPVGLILIGYDPDLIDRFELATKFGTSNYYYFAGGHDLYGREKEPLDLPGILSKIAELSGQIDAIAVSSYFSPLNPEHENEVFKVLSEAFQMPIVLGHQLSTKLGSVERATTATLNAALLAILQEFIVSVRLAMARKGIEAPLMVVRGDGTLMSDQAAALTPVETIHSGPASSAIGGRFLSGNDNALVIDIGGTTTDFALVQNGQVAVSEVGAVVSTYKTSVHAANLLSIGLGGDSLISIDQRKNLFVGPKRVVPLSYLAEEFPTVREELRKLSKKQEMIESPDQMEFWTLLREPRDKQRFGGQHQKALIELLRSGPMSLPKILNQLRLLHPLQLSPESLFQQEIIGRSNLTPTDLLHVDGRWSMWDAEAAAYALDIFCRLNKVDPEALHNLVESKMTETITQAAISFLSGKRLEAPRKLEEEAGWWFFQNSLYQSHAHLETSFRLNIPIIGIGAPAGIFLPEVARAFNTELILPEHHEVANAVGAAAGNIMVSEEILIYPRLTKKGFEVIGYYVQNRDELEEYDRLDKAIKRAREVSSRRARSEALNYGAYNPQVVIEELLDGLDTYRIRSKAIGNPRLTAG